MYVRAWMIGLLTTVTAGMILLTGCAAPQQQTGPTPEEIAARQDSIAQANRQELLKNRMFAYDYLRQGNYDRAKGYLWNVIDLDVKNEYNEWDRLYQVYMELGKSDSAQVVLDMGLEEFPSDPFLNATKGFILKAQGEYQQALMHYNTALQAEDISESDKVEYLRNKAELLDTLGQPEESIATYEELLTIDPEDSEAKDALTALVREYRDPTEYIERLEAELINSPDDMQKRMDLIHAYEEQNMNEQVITQADEILVRDPGRTSVYEMKAHAQENLNQLQNAIDTWQSLLEQDTGDANAMLRIADDLRLLGSYSQARNWIMKARANGGSRGEADFILGRTYESSGDACSAGGLDYSDKLVYTIALGLYRDAAASDDYSIKSKAANRSTYMEQFAPKKSDWFLNQTKLMPEKACYTWINESWPETNYIQTFLAQFE